MYGKSIFTKVSANEYIFIFEAASSRKILHHFSILNILTLAQVTHNLKRYLVSQHGEKNSLLYFFKILSQPHKISHHRYLRPHWKKSVSYSATTASRVCLYINENGKETCSMQTCILSLYIICIYPTFYTNKHHNHNDEELRVQFFLIKIFSQTKRGFLNSGEFLKAIFVFLLFLHAVRLKVSPPCHHFLPQ